MLHFRRNLVLRRLKLSTPPFSKLAYGLQKFEEQLSDWFTFSCFENSVPLSYAMEWTKKPWRALVMFSANSADFLHLSFFIIPLRSTKVRKNPLCLVPSIRSHSKSPYRSRLLTIFGRSSMSVWFGIPVRLVPRRRRWPRLPPRCRQLSKFPCWPSSRLINPYCGGCKTTALPSIIAVVVKLPLYPRLLRWL